MAARESRALSDIRAQRINGKGRFHGPRLYVYPCSSLPGLQERAGKRSRSIRGHGGREPFVRPALYYSACTRAGENSSFYIVRKEASDAPRLRSCAPLLSRLRAFRPMPSYCGNVIMY